MAFIDFLSDFFSGFFSSLYCPVILIILIELEHRLRMARSLDAIEARLKSAERRLPKRSPIELAAAQADPTEPEVTVKEALDGYNDSLLNYQKALGTELFKRLDMIQHAIEVLQQRGA